MSLTVSVNTIGAVSLMSQAESIIVAEFGSIFHENVLTVVNHNNCAFVLNAVYKLNRSFWSATKQTQCGKCDQCIFHFNLLNMSAEIENRDMFLAVLVNYSYTDIGRWLKASQYIFFDLVSASSASLAADPIFI